MTKLLTKIPAIIAMLISIISFAWYVESVFETVHTDIWIGSVILAILSVAIYFVDAIISFVKVKKKDDAKFNLILALVLIGAIPMVLIFGGSGRPFFSEIWNVYYLFVFVLEIISIKRIFTVK